MKLLILKIVIMIWTLVMITSCSTIPVADDEYQQQQNELNVYMISNGHYIPNHN